MTFCRIQNPGHGLSLDLLRPLIVRTVLILWPQVTLAAGVPTALCASDHAALYDISQLPNLTLQRFVSLLALAESFVFSSMPCSPHFFLDISFQAVYKLPGTACQAFFPDHALSAPEAAPETPRNGSLRLRLTLPCTSRGSKFQSLTSLKCGM
jgi:hypothetical protein